MRLWAWGRGGWWLQVWLGWGLAFVAGCGDRMPPASPVVPASEPEEIPESARYPVVSQCAGVTIRAGTPRRIDVPPRNIEEEELTRCIREEYAVDFEVAGGPEDAMLLDLFQSHTLFNWRPEVRGGEVRHAFTLRMAPRTRNRNSDLGIPTPVGIRGHEPIIVQRCPEGEGSGSVLACTTLGCGIYEDVLEVPALEPEELEAAFTVPVELLHPQPIRLGETVWVPVTHRMFGPLAEEVVLRVGVEFAYRGNPSTPEEHTDVEVSPAEIRLPAGWTRTETPLIAVRVTRLDLEGFRAANWYVSEQDPLKFRLRFDNPWNYTTGRCVNVTPDWVPFYIVHWE